MSSSSMAVAGWFTLGKSWLSQFLSVPSPWINRMDLQIVSFFRFSIRFYTQRVFDGILVCNPTKFRRRHIKEFCLAVSDQHPIWTSFNWGLPKHVASISTYINNIYIYINNTSHWPHNDPTSHSWLVAWCRSRNFEAQETGQEAWLWGGTYR